MCDLKMKFSQISCQMIKTVLIDLNGTLHIDNSIIPGAPAALKRLRETNVIVKFVTNTSHESQKFLYNKLKQLGFELVPEEIFSSLGAAQKLITSRKLKPMLMLAPEAMEDFEGLECLKGEKPDSVVIGLAPKDFHYERLNEAFRYLIDGAKLIGIHAGKYHKRLDGLALGPGLFVKGLEYAAQCEAQIVGKPNGAFFKSALGDIAPKDAIMIGDDVVNDIDGALKVGIRAYLVQTGAYQNGDENKINPMPSSVVSSFVEAVDKIVECKK